MTVNNQVTEIDFVGKVKIFGGISLILVVLSLIFLALKGLPYGIDFLGGSEIQIKFSQPIAVQDLRQAASELKVNNLSVQEFGSKLEYIVRFQLPELADMKAVNQAQNQAVEGLKSILNQGEFLKAQAQIVRVDSVGPQVGADLKKSGFLSVFYSLLFILIYVGMRFEYKFAPGAVLCLFHDVVVTLAIYALLGKEMNVPVIAAILTLIGFSLNDTIVVFDRIREIAESRLKLNFSQVINRSINEMWQRTLVTSGTTLAVSMALYFLTSGTISDIAFIMSVGIVVGTYSSVYIAAPITMWIDTLMGDKEFTLIPKPKFSES